MSKKILPLLIVVMLCAGCSKQVKRPEEMSFNELKEKALTYLDRNKHADAIVYFEKLVSQHPDNQDIFEYKFMLADLYLKVGRLEEAYSLYKHYTELYPSEIKTEEAHYKSILSKFYQTLKVSKSCDDTDTQQTVRRCEEYLKNTFYTAYRNDVRDIQYTCERRLIDKEIYVCNTYLRRKKFRSAENRINYLRVTFVKKHPALEAQLLYLESKLAKKQGDTDLAKQKVELLEKTYPDSRFTRMAQGASSKKRFIF